MPNNAIYIFGGDFLNEICVNYILVEFFQYELRQPWMRISDSYLYA